MISSTWLRTASSEMPRRLERLGGDAFALVDQTEQDVLGADVVVVEQARFFLGQHHDPPGPVGEAFEHDATSIGVELARTCMPDSLGPMAPTVRPTCASTGRVRGRGSPAWRVACRRGALRAPLLALPGMADGSRNASRRRCVESVRTTTRTSTEIAGAPDRGRRQAAPAGARRGRRPGRRPADAELRRRRSRAASPVELVHLGSLYHDDVIDEADDPARRRDRQRQVGQPAGHPRRRLPAGAGLGDRRVARHRGRRPAGRTIGRLCEGQIGSCATPTTRPAPERATWRRSAARRRRCSPPRRASAGIVAGCDRALTSTRSPTTARPTAWCSRSSTTSSTSPSTDEQLGKPAGHDMVEGVYTLPVLRTLQAGGVPAMELLALLGKPLDAAERDKTLAHRPRQRRCRLGVRHGAGLGAPGRVGLRRAARLRGHRGPPRRPRRPGRHRHLIALSGVPHFSRLREEFRDRSRIVSRKPAEVGRMVSRRLNPGACLRAFVA